MRFAARSRRDAPEQGEEFDAIFADFERIILPGVTHWNHPGFFAYFAITSSAPGVLAEFLSAALNAAGDAVAHVAGGDGARGGRARLAAPADRACPTTFEGVIYDTASVSTLHALAAAREAAVPDVRARGPRRAARPGRRPRLLPRARALVGRQGGDPARASATIRCTRIPADAEFRMRPELLATAIAADRAAGLVPIAVVATVGSTSTTSVDPVDEIAAICAREQRLAARRRRVRRRRRDGARLRMDPARRRTRPTRSCVNPHKWLFTPFDLSVLYCRRMDVCARRSRSRPSTSRRAKGTRACRNLMDTGIQLGRRFRALKLWMIMRHFGAEGLRGHLAEHMRLARLFADWVDRSDRFERVAPVPFSVVCFRLRGGATDAEHQRVLDTINASGEVFLSHTKLDGRYVLRLAIGNLHTTEAHVARAWSLLQQTFDQLHAG